MSMTAETLLTTETDTGELKPGWRVVRFGDVVSNVDISERQPLEQGLERFVGLDHLDPESLHIKRWGLIEEGTSFTRKFVSGQVLFGKRRAYQRKAAVAEFDGICSGDILVFEPKGNELLPELLPFIVQSDGFFEHALGTSAGSLSPRTKWSDLARYEFALPPKDEQRRIADILWAADEVAAKYDNAIESMNAFRQSMLQRYYDCSANDECQKQRVMIGELIEKKILAPPQDGNHGELHPVAADFVETGVPFIMANNVRGKQVDLTNCKFIPRRLADKLRIGFSYQGDILLTHKGTVGEVAIVPEIETDYIMLTPQVTYYRVLDEEALDRKYLYYCLQSPFFQKQLARASSQSTRDYIGILAQRKLLITLPPLEVQKEIASKLSQIDKQLNRLHKHIGKCINLKASCLTLLSN